MPEKPPSKPFHRSLVRSFSRGQINYQTALSGRGGRGGVDYAQWNIYEASQPFQKPSYNLCFTPLLRACVNCYSRSPRRGRPREDHCADIVTLSRLDRAGFEQYSWSYANTCRDTWRYNPLVNILSRGAAVPRGRTLSNDRLSSTSASVSGEQILSATTASLLLCEIF